MNYLKIFLKPLLIVFLLFAGGCVSRDNIAAIESTSKIEKSNDISVVFKPEQNNTEDSTPVISLPVIPPALEIEELDDVIVETVVWTDPEEDNFFPGLLMPEVQVREKKKDIVIIPPLFHYYEMGPQEGEVKTVYVSSTVIDPLTKPEEVIETLPEKNLLQSASENTGKMIEEVSTKLIVNESQISGVVGMEVDITLSDHGWIYLSDKGNRGIEYVGRHFSANDTVYTFLPEVEGSFVLQFQFQDLVNNNHTIEQINLTILPEEIITSKEIVPFPLEAEFPETNGTADLEESLQVLLSEGDSRGLSEIAPMLVESTLPSIRKQLPEIAELLFSSSYFVQSALIVEELLKDHTLYISADRLLFLLGKIYEENSSIRNERTSASYYKKLIDGYPASIYWDESQDRYRYLKRRYIDIR
jgi:hypothetical protein